MENNISPTLKNYYNEYQRIYKHINKDKIKQIQQKYKQNHPKTEEQKNKDREYAKNYYLLKKHNNNNNNNTSNDNNNNNIENYLNSPNDE